MSGEATRRDPEYGETWVYESIVGALPGVNLTPWQAVAIQVGLFEGALLVLAAVEGLWSAVPAGSVAVGVAGLGSVAMHRLGERARSLRLPTTYRRLLFGSSIEVVLSLLAFVAFVTYLFVVDPARPGATLLGSLLGDRPSPPAVALLLLVVWDLCYRVGTSWWVAVVSLWRARTCTLGAETARAVRRLDALNVGFALTQTALLPFVWDHPVLAFAVGGHVVAVVVVSAAASMGQRISRP